MTGPAVDAHPPTSTRRTQHHRDMHLASGLEDGMQIWMDRMEAIIGELGAA